MLKQVLTETHLYPLTNIFSLLNWSVFLDFSLPPHKRPLLFYFFFTSGNTTIKQSRYRIIIQEAANGGQECPDTLFEERECEDVSLCSTYR